MAGNYNKRVNNVLETKLCELNNPHNFNRLLDLTDESFYQWLRSVGLLATEDFFLLVLKDLIRQRVWVAQCQWQCWHCCLGLGD